MKNKYLVENEEIEFRRAHLNDNFFEIADLIYKTDPYIYPFWFENDIDAARVYLSKLFKREGNLFYIDNLYVAFDKTSQKIVGVLCAIDKNVNLDYDFSIDQKINSNYKITIDKYVKVIHDEVKSFDNYNTLYISNLCISDSLRGKKIGSYLLGYFISQMENSGFDTFELDCLLHNLRAKNLYHSMGFKEMKEIVGFDGTDDSKVEVVSFLRKKGNYYPNEFQVSIMDNN